MKIILYLILSLPFLCLAAATPQNGLYHCIEGNNDSICDQKLKIRYSQNEVSSISIEYVGDCGSQGPYIYSCHKGICSDGIIEIKFQESETYFWKNISYDINCKMQKSKQ
jgi:hypothetical protein